MHNIINLKTVDLAAEKWAKRAGLLKKWWESSLPFIKNVKNFELANQFKGATINYI